MTTDGARVARETAETAADALGVLRDALPEGRERDPRGYPVEGRRPAVALAPHTREEVAAGLAAAARGGLAVVPQAGRTALAAGGPLQRYDVALDLRELDRVVEHEPADLTITVEAGLGLGALADLLRPHGQQLPLDPPGGEGVSVGGMLASARPGSWRGLLPGAGDLLLGATVALPDGALARSGGRVVKNVAGYDLHRLHTGALGAFGVIVEASFKLVPLPQATATVVCRCQHLPQADGLARTLRHTPLAARGLALVGARAAAASGLGPAPHVIVGLAGAAAALDRSVREVRLCCRSAHVPHADVRDGDEGWGRLRALAAGAGSEIDGGDGTPLVVRGSLPVAALAAVLEEAEEAGFAAWAHLAAGSLLAVAPPSGEAGDRERVALLRERCEAAGGALAIESGPAALRAALDPTARAPDEVALDIARELRSRFDPLRTVNPGRWPRLDDPGERARERGAP